MQLSNLTPFILFLVLVSCSEPVKENTESIETLPEPIAVKNQEETPGANFASLSEEKFSKFKTGLKQFVIKETYIDGLYGDRKDVNFSFSEDGKLDYEFIVSRLDDDIYDDVENATMIDTIKVEGNVNVLEVNDDRVSFSINANVSYRIEEYSYYGTPNIVSDFNVLGQDGSVKLSEVKEEVDPSKIVSSWYYKGKVRKLKRSELLGLTLDELGYIRNEFFARKGFRFKTDKMKSYFGDKSWYTATTDDYPKMTDIELFNIYFIKSMEAEIRLSESKEQVNQISEAYQLGQSNQLDRSDLSHLDVHQLNYLRNEFYARKGYQFKSKRLSEYFSQFDWYSPETTEDITSRLSELELENIELIRSLEKEER